MIKILIRQPLVSVLGHVDHGKTTLLDYIRQSKVASGESGGITQHIGASEVPANVIKKLCGKMMEKFKLNLNIPGLLFIDTPGHEAFTLLRKRGGALADISILIIDVTEGFKPQTDEALTILKQCKTPFIIAASKIDKISGWIKYKDSCFLDSFSKQRTDVQEELDKKIYELMGQFYEKKVPADRFDRIQDFTKQVPIIPVCALEGEGISELLTLLAGLSQKYLGKKLEIDEKGNGKGVILEVKEVKGLGITLDVILYDGLIKKGDELVISHPNEPIVTKVRALLKISPLKEMRVEKQFKTSSEVSAAAGIKISAHSLENVIAGAQLIAVRDEKGIEKAKQELQKEIERVEIETEKKGVVIKADALGSLEAMVKILKDLQIPIKKAKIGSINKKDVIELEGIDEKLRVVFAFGTKILPDAEKQAKDSKVKILQNSVIYKLIDDYNDYVKDIEERKKSKILEKVMHPAKIKILHGFVFRQSKPAIVGVEILGGVLSTDMRLMKNDGKTVGDIVAVQEHGETAKSAKIGQRVAISIDGAVVGRNIREDDVLFTVISGRDYKFLIKNRELVSDNELNVLEEIKEIMTKKNPRWEFG